MDNKEKKELVKKTARAWMDKRIDTLMASDCTVRKDEKATEAEKNVAYVRLCEAMEFNINCFNHALAYPPYLTLYVEKRLEVLEILANVTQNKMTKEEIEERRKELILINIALKEIVNS